MSYCNTKKLDVQSVDEILCDSSSTGRKLPWKEHKMANQLLASAYDEINISKALRLRECSSWLEFSVGSDGKKKLTDANFCRVRLCPICSWRRGLKIFAHTTAILNAISGQNNYSYIFVTLTIRNCVVGELNSLVDDMMTAWNRFAGYKAFKQAVKGWYRGLEITHNVDFASKDFNTFHPHFHCLMAVNKSYFTSSKYLSQENWTTLWSKAMRLDYIPVVDVRRVKGKTAAAVSEVAKYAVKTQDYIIPDDWDLTVDTVRILDEVLSNRRLVAYGGILKEWHKKLNLDDELNGDLVNLSSQDESIDEPVQKVYYSWNVGYNQYIKTDSIK